MPCPSVISVGARGERNTFKEICSLVTAAFSGTLDPTMTVSEVGADRFLSRVIISNDRWARYRNS